MNQWKGSLYLMALSSKREFGIFWLINASFLLLSLVLCSVFPEITVFTMGVMSSCIFTLIISLRFMDKTLAISLRYGLNRMKYVGAMGIFIVIWSLSHAFLLMIINAILMWGSEFWAIDNLIIPTLSSLFANDVSPFIGLLVDTSILILITLFGLLINTMFYRFGVVGGYGFIGLLAFVLFIGMPFKLYIPVVESLMGLNLAQFCGIVLTLAVIVYATIYACTNRISTISANM